MAKKTTARPKAALKSDAPDTPAAAPKPRTRVSAPKRKPKAAGGDEATIMLDTHGVSTIVSPAEPSDDDIRTRAYHRYLERGGTPGMAFEDWIEAERELRQRK